MRNILLLICLLCSLGAYTPLQAQSNAACQAYFPTQKGAKWEVQTYNRKDKSSGSIRYEVLDVKQVGSNFEIMLRVEVLSEKGKTVGEATDAKFICTPNELLVDFRLQNSANSALQNTNVEMRFEENKGFVPLPHRLQVGQDLPDGDINAEILMNGQKTGSMSNQMRTRKVLAEEEVNCPAGSFKCFKIEESFSSETRMMGVPVRFKGKNITWLAQGIGAVKSESYDEKGKKVGSTLLSKFEK